MKNNIILIGAGQLGSRHLQGLLKMNTPVRIFVVDPNENSLNITKERANEIHSNISVSYHPSIAEIEETEFILAVIATGANIRALVTERILFTKSVSNVIFEKILFQKVEDYYRIKTLLEQNGCVAWVNCPRRLQPLYLKIAEYFKSIEKLKMIVTGNNWGLACNGIHFLDLFYFLSKYKVIPISTDVLDSKIIDSKRSGYKEITGTIIGNDGNFGFEITSSSIPGTAPIRVILEINEIEVIINESTGNVSIKELGNTKVFTEPFLFQSDLTGLVADKLISKGVCDLTKFDESMEIHLDYIEKIQSHIELSLGKELDLCPIT